MNRPIVAGVVVQQSLYDKSIDFMADRPAILAVATDAHVVFTAYLVGMLPQHVAQDLQRTRDARVRAA